MWEFLSTPIIEFHAFGIHDQITPLVCIILIIYLVIIIWGLISYFKHKSKD